MLLRKYVPFPVSPGKALLMNNIFNDQPEGRIRPMQRANLVRVHDIECESQAHPWTLAHFRAELENPVASVDVYIQAGEIAGFLCSWLIAGELQIQNLATACTSRRQGVAGRLLKHVLARSRTLGMQTAWLEVRAHNSAAIALYRTWDFTISTRRAGYYQDGEDALLMYRHETRQAEKH